MWVFSENLWRGAEGTSNRILIMSDERVLSLHQSAILGNFEFVLSNEELAMLQLISTKSNNSLSYWEKVWQDINDYEELTFSCKEMMPSAVKKVQDSYSQSSWKDVTKGNAEFLSGLPRYTWTKNQYIINQYRIIAEALKNENIDFIALKGVCEMIANSNLSMMRTSRDIDMLVRIEDWDKCLEVFNKIGWELVPIPESIEFLVTPGHPHARTLCNKDRIIDLDVHFSAIGGPRSFSMSFTNHLWERKVRSEKYPDLFIPSVEDRFIIAAGNAYNLHNWSQGQTCKYLFDGLLISDNMDLLQIEKTFTIAEQQLKMGQLMIQFVDLLKKIRGVEQSEPFRRRNYFFRYPVRGTFILYAVYQSYLKEWLRLSYSISQTLYILLFILLRLIREVFVRMPLRLFRSSDGKKSSISVRQRSQKQLFWYLYASSIKK